MNTPRHVPALLIATVALAMAPLWDVRAAGDEASKSAAQDAPANRGAVALVRGDAANAVSSLTSALSNSALTKDRRAAYLNDRGVAYMRIGQVKLAFDDFNKAAKLFPEFAAIYNNRGNLLLSLNLTREAIKDFDRAIVLAPGYAAAYNNRASALFKSGKLQDALRDYTKAIKLTPQSPAPLSGRGRANLALDRPHAAIRDFSRAVTADARFASGYRNRAEAKLQVEHFEAAIEDLSRAVAFDTKNAEIYMVRGEAYLSMKNVAAALRDFTQAIEINPKLGRAYEGRGLAHGYAEAYDNAYADLNKAIELDPRSPVAFAYRAFVYKQNGQLDIALKDLETARKLGENVPEVLWAMAGVEEAQGQVPVAIAHLKKALALKPGYKDAADALVRLGVAPVDSGVKVVEDAGIEPWRVVKRNGRYYALTDLIPGLRVPLEMLGQGEPRLLNWEVKEPPIQGIGILSFFGGTLKSASGPEDIEYAAIVDIDARRVMTIVPDRQGKARAKWTWEPGRVVVASVDGVTDEFSLRTAPVADRRGYDGRYPRSGGATSAWAPWDQPWAGGFGDQRPRTTRRAVVKKKKPKTLFDLLFN